MTPQERQTLDRIQFQQNEQKQRLDALCTKMNKFCADVSEELKRMAEAHKPKESN